MLSDSNGEVVKQPVQELEGGSLSPFKYHHLGSFAYVGDNKAVLQLPIIGKTPPTTAPPITPGGVAMVTMSVVLGYRVFEWVVDHVAVASSICFGMCLKQD